MVEDENAVITNSEGKEEKVLTKGLTRNGKVLKRPPKRAKSVIDSSAHAFPYLTHKIDHKCM
jgi:hypothetical protein